MNDLPPFVAARADRIRDDRQDTGTIRALRANAARTARRPVTRWGLAGAGLAALAAVAVWRWARREATIPQGVLAAALVALIAGSATLAYVVTAPIAVDAAPTVAQNVTSATTAPAGAPDGTGSGPQSTAGGQNEPQAAVAVPDAPHVDIPWLPATVARWAPLIEVAAARHGVDPALVAIVVTIESCGNPRAESGSGARGLTQVMPATGAGIAAQLGVAGWTADALWDPSNALDFGAYYLAQQLRTFGRADDPDWAQSVGKACMAYNGGPGTVLSGRIPAETQRYYTWCSGMWAERNDATSATFDAWHARASGMCARAAEVTP